MIKRHSGLRAALATIAVGLACTSCSAFSAFSTSTKPTVQPAPTEAGAPVATPSAAPARATTRQRRQARQARQRLVAGVNGYCRAFYVAQKDANVRYPTSAGNSRRSLVLASDTRHLVARLDSLRAPSSQVATELRGFIRNERGLVRAFTQEASSDPGKVSVGDAAYNDVLTDRHEYASSLGVRECDGLLPHDQGHAAVAATRRWAVTTSQHAACVSLVTSEFAVESWGDTGSPLGTCFQEFHTHPVPRAIRVQSVTGVEDLQATVTFTEVPDCGCGTLVAKLYFERGRWLIDHAYEQ